MAISNWYKFKLGCVTFSLVLSAFCGMHPVYTPIILFYLLFPQWGRYMIDRIGCRWYMLSVFFTEKVHGQKITVYGDWSALSTDERVLILCNHPSEGDWFWFWSLAWRKGCIQAVKIILKQELRYLPGPGWCMDLLSFVFLSRRWVEDRERFIHQINKLTRELFPMDRLWLVIFPEGTDFSEEKHNRSIEYSKSKDLPIYRHHLLPRTTGFLFIQSLMRDKISAVYDVTVAYEPREGDSKPSKPTFVTTLCGEYPKNVHLYIRRTSISDLPTGEAELTEWLYESFKKKDELVNNFIESGAKGFPGEKKIELAPLPFTVYFWPIVWHIGVFLSFYLWCTSWKYLAYCAVTSTFFVLCSFYRPLRVFMKFDPPLTKNIVCLETTPITSEPNDRKDK